MNNHEKIWLSILKEGEMTPNELNILDSKLVCPITDFAILQVTGNDRYEFLQNQLTGDLKKSEVKSEFSSWCNLKGRVIANFLTLNTTESYLLVLKKDMADYVLKKLKMYILRSDVKINDITEEMLLIGFANYNTHQSPLVSLGPGPGREDWSMFDLSNSGGKYGNRPGYLIKLPDFSNRFLAITHVTETENLLHHIYECRNTIVNFKIWNKLDILAGFAWIDFKNKEKFLPQMLNLDKFGAVSFSKGCYVGQEVIARLHYRGKVKKSLQLFKTKYNYKLNSIEDGYLYQNDASTKIGEILNFDNISNTTYGLAVIESDKLDKAIYADKIKMNKLEVLPMNMNFGEQ